MFYKVLPDTDTHAKMQTVQVKMSTAWQEAKALVEEFGGTGFADDSGFGVIRGGIGYVRMAEKRKGWNKTEQENVYYPGERAKEDKKKISKLPKVTCDEMNTILGYEEWEKPNPNDHGSILTFCPSVQWKNGEVVFRVDDDDPYRPNNPDIQEITRSEYEAIVNAEKTEG